MLHNLKKKGFASIVEVIVTSVVFVIAVAGISSTITMFKPQGTASAKKIEAAYIGKGVIDNLRQELSAEDWDSPFSSLFPGSYSVTINGYTVNYTIAPDVADVRQLTMDISWPD